MEFRLKIPLAVILSTALLLLLGAFAASDRVWLHWYTPDLGRLEVQLEDMRHDLKAADEVSASNARKINSLRQEVDTLKAGKARTDLLTGALGRIATAVTINSLVSNVGGFQRSDSPAGVACRNWLLLGVGSITDCGFTR